MWDIYDTLIEGIPNDLRVDDIISSIDKAYVRSGGGVGYGITVPFYTNTRIHIKNMETLKLKEVAKLIKSWNLKEAAIGHGAINAYYNNPEIAEKNGVNLSANRFTEDRLNDPFIAYQNQIAGKKVAVIGHFHYLEQLYQPICDLTIVESEVVEGDYPYAACEYLLPEQDYVVITSSSIVDKSLPRLLELSKNAYVIIVGPTTTLAPVLFEFGVNDLAGFVIKDTELAHQIGKGTDNSRIYRTGQKVSLKANSFCRT
ncbi:MAG: putative heavy-metal chelation [Anaerocolumna sp.]|jgi:uncharacterized protein (DUF4213/DUF364 family)|nr:putative heavy-metal chelation [Anaerocolumna sp.]